MAQFIRSLKLTNLLSFGPNGCSLALGPLTVLIGPNGAGKSNLIEAISLLQAAPSDLLRPVREGGGIQEWLWKGKEKNPVASIEAVVEYREGIMPLRYTLAFTQVANEFIISNERLENEEALSGYHRPYFFFGYEHGRPMFNVRTSPEEPPGTDKGRSERRLRSEDLDPHQSVLFQRRDPSQYPEITYLGDEFRRIRLFREWNMGRYTPARDLQAVDASAGFLAEDCSNLAVVLNALKLKGDAFQIIRDHIRELSDGFVGLETILVGQRIQVYLEERGLASLVPATRLSDGTIRYLCLLVILCHPEPPPLICLEEPELGLHPEVIASVAKLLREAAQRTQIIVTTHSVELVDELTEEPESVGVCERGAEGTMFHRLEASALDKWLERYTLGELWQKGEIGGTRW